MLNSNILPQEIFQKRKEIGLEACFQLLSEIISTNKDNFIRKQAIKYLGLISNNSVSLRNVCFDIMENLLISDDETEIKCEAAKKLGRIKYEKALEPLNWTLKQESLDVELEKSVLNAIREIRFQDKEIRLFIDKLGSKSNSIKKYVQNQLINLPPEKLIYMSLDFLNKETISNDHKKEIIKLIGYELSSIYISFEDVSYLKFKYPEIINALIQDKDVLLEIITLVLKEEDSELMNSIITISKILGPEIEKDILKLLLIDDFIVKKNAIKLSGKLKLGEAVDFLTSNLDNMYNEVSIASIEALGEIGEISAVPDLLDVLNIEDISFEYTDLDMKFYILDAIKKIYLKNEDASYDYLYSNLKKRNDTIRESIAFILGEIGKEDFVKPLIELLKVRSLDVKKNAAIALGKIGNIDSLDHLIEILEDKESYWLIKKVAVDAIYNVFQRNWYKLKDDKDELVRKLIKDLYILMDYLKLNENENFKVKLSLIKFLGSFGGQEALSALIKRVNDFHRVVRIHASNAIKRIEERLELENA